MSAPKLVTLVLILRNVVCPPGVTAGGKVPNEPSRAETSVILALKFGPKLILLVALK